MSIFIEQNVMVTMRDGVNLSTTIYRPAQDGQWPVLIARHPYDKSRHIPFPGWEDKILALDTFINVERVVTAGYVVILQDIRGRFASEGNFTPFIDDANDGEDTIAWAANQPWSTGQVGMIGVSYQALAQWQAAITQPTALRAIAPSQSPHAYGIYPYQGGAFMPGFALPWIFTSMAPAEMQRRVNQGTSTPEDMTTFKQALTNLDALLTHLPLNDQPLLQAAAPYYLDWVAHPTYDDYWRAARPNNFYEHITIPALTISGWYDMFLPNDLHHHQELKKHAGSTLAREQQHLVIGPWSHGNFMLGYPDRKYGPNGEAVSPQTVQTLTDIQLRWFDHWLKGIDNNITHDKPVHIFVMGIDQWRDEAAWPLPDTNYQPFYLHSSGHAHTSHGDGLLSPNQPEHSAIDTYLYDPHNPVPTSGDPTKLNGNIGPFDQAVIEERPDVLCYTTAPLTHPIEVTGPIKLILYVSSSAPDTDFTGKLVEVHPNGRAEFLTDGILRARYRQSLSHPTLMEPDHIYELHIDLGATSNVFLPGHSIRLEVSSSNFPRFDRNSNTGGPIHTETSTAFIPATNHIHHSELHPSRLILPIIDR